MIHRCRNVSTRTALMCDAWILLIGMAICHGKNIQQTDSSPQNWNCVSGSIDLKLLCHINLAQYIFETVGCLTVSIVTAVGKHASRLQGFMCLDLKRWPFSSVKIELMCYNWHIIPAKRVIHNVVESCCEQRWCRPSRPHLLQQVTYFIPKKEKRTKCPLAVTLQERWRVRICVRSRSVLPDPR